MLIRLLCGRVTRPLNLPSNSSKGRNWRQWTTLSNRVNRAQVATIQTAREYLTMDAVGAETGTKAGAEKEGGETQEVEEDVVLGDMVAREEVAAGIKRLAVQSGGV